MVTCDSWDSISAVFSTMSLFSWVCAQMPQIYANYYTKQADGISPSFLVLWFLGDFLSFTSCLLNDVVLRFQVYLSVFFLMNDVTLCFQYYYYNSVYPQRHFVPESTGALAGSVTADVEAYQHAESMEIRSHGREPSNSLMQSSDSTASSYDSTGTSSKAARAIVGSSLVAAANAMSLEFQRRSASGTESLGLFLAWCCTFVYMISRCPQLWKNYRRKSVAGVSPILFGAALMGNLTYSISILTSCALMNGDAKNDFFLKELPYILGSSGTVVFDIMYFYQRYLYRDAGTNTSTMVLENWD